MESKNDPIFNKVIAACEAKHVKGIMGFKKNWSSEVIAQFYATRYFEDNDGHRKLHWMTKGRWYEVEYNWFTALFGFGKNDQHSLY